MLADPRAAAVDAVVRLTAVLAAQCVLRRRVLQVLSPVYISPLRIFGGIEGGTVVMDVPLLRVTICALIHLYAQSPAETTRTRRCEGGVGGAYECLGGLS